VTILDEWVVDGSYATQDATFHVSAGTNRIVLVGLSSEKDGNGPIAVTSVSLRDQARTEAFDFTVGRSTAYHNYQARRGDRFQPSCRSRLGPGKYRTVLEPRVSGCGVSPIDLLH